MYLRNRKGFIVYALRYGYRVSPVYTFGEELLYSSFERWPNFRLWLNKWKIPCGFGTLVCGPLRSLT